MTEHNSDPEYVQYEGSEAAALPMSPAYIQELKERDMSKRKITAALTSVPIMMVAAVTIGIPIVMFNIFNLMVGLLMTVIAEVITIGVALLIAKSGKNWKQALRLHKFNWKQALLGGGIGVGLFIGLQLLAQGVNAVAPDGGGIESSETSTMLASASGIELYIIMLLLVPFVVPFIEEVFFRGYVFGFLKDSRMPLWSAFAVSIFYFAIMHSQGFSTFGDMFIIVWTGIIAFVHAWLVYKYDSIWPAVFSHVIYNLITAVISLLQMT